MNWTTFMQSEFFWTTVIGVWLTQMLSTMIVNANVLRTGPVWRAIRALHGLLDKIDPPAASVKIIGGALFIGYALLLAGCAGSFDESTGKLSLAPAPRKAADPATCLAISRRASLERGLAVAGAVLTGVDGIAAWPIDSKDGRLGLAIGGTVLASGTALVLVLWQNDAAAYIEAGCAAPKEAIK